MSQMPQLETIGRLVFDLNQVETVIDRGDYLVFEFHLFHRPPYLHFYGADADALRTWNKKAAGDSTPLVSTTTQATIRRTLAQLDVLEQEALSGTLSREQAIQLITTLRTVQKDRDKLVTENIRSKVLIALVLLVRTLNGGCKNAACYVSTLNVEP